MRKQDDFIVGIFNYCDRWCERCDITGRCRLYHDLARIDRRHKRRGEDPDDIDVALKDVDRNFKGLMRLICRDAKKMGIDLDEIARQAAQAPAVDRSKIDEHPLAREGMSFFKTAQKLLKALSKEIGQSREDISRRSEFMEVAGEARRLAKICDAHEVLNWDSSMVAVKIKRAISSLFKDGEENSDADSEEFHLQDAQATAALVLSCLERDKLALLTIYDWSKDDQDAAVGLLAKAERMSRGLNQLMPGAAGYLKSIRIGGAKGRGRKPKAGR